MNRAMLRARPDLMPGLFLCLLGCFVVTMASGCSDRGGPSPFVPYADMSEEIEGPGAPFIGSSTSFDLAAAGYVEHEYVAEGDATSYVAIDKQTPDGRWNFASDDTAHYRTRVLVRRPADAKRFSGTVVVEWLNVSGGLDADPDWASLAEEIVRQGHAWVGVSAQLIGIEGGPVLVTAPGAEGITGKGLKALFPDRYGSLAHPGDGYAFDIFTQVGLAVRLGAGLLTKPDYVIAAGESQSAIALTTYYNGVQPITHAFDGFFVHSRAFVGLPLVGPGEYADLAAGFATTPTILRTDLDVPAFELQAESDVTGVLNSVVVRQPDSETFRLWEVAGTAHADRHLLGPIADLTDCGAPVNDGPMHVVAKAAFHHLEAWVRGGDAPPIAARLETSSSTPVQVLRDADGIALGGIRTPPVDVPAVVLSGIPGSNPDLLCILLGSTTPLSDARLAELYTGPADYQQRYDAGTDAAIGAGFVLEADRAALEAYALPGRIPG
jgi:hypothetical protein